MQIAVGSSLRILLASSTAVVLAAGLVLWIADSQATTATADVEAMRARWQAHPVPHYRRRSPAWDASAHVAILLLK